MARPSATYEPRHPSQSVVFQVVRDHFEAFRARAAALRGGDGLPRFVPFSCKGRAECQSCGARRMAERAAHLVGHVLPPVPVRRWVLTLPYRLRYGLAWDHDLCRAVVGVFLRGVLGFQRRAARRALNPNVHVHALVIDGVFVSEASGVAFAPAGALSDLDVADLLATVVPRMHALLVRRGLAGEEGEGGALDGSAEAAPTLAGMAAAAVQGTTAAGDRAGVQTRRCGEALDHAGAGPLPPCHASQDGFDLEAGMRVRADQRDRLERLCRYVLRPPLADERLRLLDNGDVLLALERRWSDGTTHLRLSPVEVLERLAVLIPRPRVNLVLYHGVPGLRGPAAAGGAHRRPGGCYAHPPTPRASRRSPGDAARAPATPCR
jgi:hypothetical protein